MTLYVGSDKIKNVGEHGVYLGSQNTNCLTYTPKNIDLELANGTLTLKAAGSKVYIPNGRDINVGVVGSPTINNGVVSGFSTSNYLVLPNAFYPESNTWEMVYKFTTGDNVTTQGVIASSLSKTYFIWTYENSKFHYNIGNGSKWLVSGDARYGSKTVSSNTTYWIKATYDGSIVKVFVSDDGVDYQLDWSYTTTQKIPSCTVVLGQGYSLGSTNVPQSIDLTQSYIKINDSIWWQGKAGNGSLKFDEVVIKSDISLNASTYGTTFTDAFLVYELSSSVLHIASTSSSTSGTSAPSVDVNRRCWYDTSSNIIKMYAPSSSSYVSIGFPIANISTVANTSFTIKQVFDWCGYIGSTAFVLPGVKGMIPNGFNADGTYKSTEFETDRVLLNTYNYQGSNQIAGVNDVSAGIRFARYIESKTQPTWNTWSLWYNPQTNLLHSSTGQETDGWLPAYCVKYVQSISTDSTYKITSLTPYTAQPENTYIPVNAIYHGSDLVYQFIPTGEVLFEQSTAGTYTFTAPYNCTVDVVIVGGGGGGSYSNSYNGGWTNSKNGGSAGMVKGSIAITKGTTYTIVVGAAGTGLYSVNSGGGAGGTAGTGGSSTAFGNTARGGSGAYTWTGWVDSRGTAGAAGTATAVSGFTASNGAAGSTASRYGSYGGGGNGSGGSVAGNTGGKGYVRITVKG